MVPDPPAEFRAEGAFSRRELLLDLAERCELRSGGDTTADLLPLPEAADSLREEADALASRLSRVARTLDAPLRNETPQFVALGLTLRIVRPLARGGQGSVYLAFDETLKREVALKTAHWGDSGSVLRLRKEAEIASRLNHPGIVPILGVGTTELGLPFLVMRFVPGVTLERYLSDATKEDASDVLEARVRRALEAFSTTCRTVAYAHERGILHGDLKPQNILLGALGETALLDWGLSVPFRQDAKPPHAIDITGGSALRSHATHCGTPDYMSPERLAGDENLGFWTDIYALGAILDRVLRGRRRRSSGSDDAPAPQGEAATAGLPLSGAAKRKLTALADWACATEPAARPTTASALADCVDEALAQHCLTTAPRRSLLSRLFRRTRD
ncbi:MAG TPA: serine/threonine-protein kinase [Pirellulaceae bacterium]|jgi:serine/threonine-protein kinase|nr:serine/threonine-protein kinase [Pirellulaceae bacterium]